jgi:hypothetical protein
MRLTLCLPGLLLPRQALLDTVVDLELPALSRLLGRSRLHRDTPSTHYLRVMQRWNLEELPAAALRLLGEGGTPGAGYWLCLDPVHFSVDRRGVKLADPASLALSAAEDAALQEALRPLLAELGELSASAPGHWNLRLHNACELVTLPPDDVAGHTVDPTLPGGRDGMRWRRLLAEAQLLLHRHPVNQAREAAGRPTANSLWPWGQGRLVPMSNAPFDTIWSRDAVLRGLARASGIEGAVPPPRFEIAAGNVLAVLDDLVQPAHALDALAWREALAGIERDWIAPAMAALGHGHCYALHLAAFGVDASVDLDISNRDLLKFWRRPLPLTRLAS